MSRSQGSVFSRPFSQLQANPMDKATFRGQGTQRLSVNSRPSFVNHRRLILWLQTEDLQEQVN